MKPKTVMKFIIKPIIWIGGIFPLTWLFWLTYSNGLGANPIEFVNRSLGETGLKFLAFSLCITPVRILTNWAPITGIRRLLGLFSFFYILLHFCFYISVEQFFDWNEILQDLLKRKFITVGFVGFLLLIPLALTSTKGMVKRLGGKLWKTIHKGAYFAAVLGCVHFFMMRKGFQLEPLYYGAFIVSMLLIRYIGAIRAKS